MSSCPCACSVRLCLFQVKGSAGTWIHISHSPWKQRLCQPIGTGESVTLCVCLGLLMSGLHPADAVLWLVPSISSFCMGAIGMVCADWLLSVLLLLLLPCVTWAYLGVADLSSVLFPWELLLSMHRLWTWQHWRQIGIGYLLPVLLWGLECHNLLIQKEVQFKSVWFLVRLLNW